MTQGAISSSFQQFYNYAQAHPLDPVPNAGIRQDFTQGDSQLVVSNPCQTVAFSTLVAATCGRAIENWLNDKRAFDQRMYWIQLQSPTAEAPIVGLFNVEPSDSVRSNMAVGVEPGLRDLCTAVAGNFSENAHDIGVAASVARS